MTRDLSQNAGGPQGEPGNAIPEAKRRLLLNVGSNTSALLVAVAVGMWQVPYLLRHLGVEAYGQIGVLRSIVDYAALITFAFTSTIGRFMSIALNRKDNAEVNRYFNTSLLALAVLCLAAMGASAALRPFLPGLIDSPPGIAPDVGRLFILLMLASCVTSLNSPSSSVPFARHRFDLINAAKIAGLAIQVVVLVVAFNVLSARLTYLGCAYVLKETLVLGCMTVLAYRLAPGLRLNVRAFCRRAATEMAGMSAWLIVNRAGFLFYFSIDLIVINAVLGSSACGRYAPMTQLAFLLTMFVVAVADVFRPIAYEHIAHQRFRELGQDARRTAKFMGLLFGLPIGLLCGLASVFLAVWLGPEWSAYSPLLMVLIIPSAVNAPVKHLLGITHGMNKVKIPAVVTVCGGVVNLVLSVILVKYTPLGLYGVAVATALALTIRNVLFVPFYVARLLHQPAWTFLSGILPGFAATLLLTGAGLVLSRILGTPSWPKLLGAGAGLSAAYALLCAVLLNRDEWRFLFSLVTKRGRNA